MSTTQDETTLEALLARLSDLERQLATLRAEHPISGSLTTNHSLIEARGSREESGEAPRLSKRRSRRGLLRTALVSGAAVVGAGALLGKSTGVAHADGSETPTAFTSDNSQVPYAVSANGTNGADGVYATSDSGTAIFVRNVSQYGLHAVVGGASPSAGPGAAGVFAEGDPTTACTPPAAVAPPSPASPARAARVSSARAAAATASMVRARAAVGSTPAARPATASRAAARVAPASAASARAVLASMLRAAAAQPW